MLTDSALVDFRRRRIENLRDAYNNKTLSMERKIEARKDLEAELGFLAYREKIQFITGELAFRKKKIKEFSIIYFVFTKCFDFLLSYDSAEIMREKYLDYCDLLYIFLSKKNEKELSDIHSPIFNQIKTKTFDLESMLFLIGKQENAIVHYDAET